MTNSSPRDAEGPPSGDPKPSSLFQCGLCKQRYKRPDHLARHVRSHYQYKPHRCHICGKAFSRTDLLNRHVASHSDQNARTKGNPSGVRDVQSRVSRACRACATNHLRCTESKPCKRCTEKGLDCDWDGQLAVDETSEPSPRTVPQHEQEAEQQQHEEGQHPSQSQAPPYDSTSMAGFAHQPLPTPQSESPAPRMSIAQELPQQQQPQQQPQPQQPQHEAEPGHHHGPEGEPPLDPSRQDHDYDYQMSTPVETHPHMPIDTAATRSFPDWNFLPGWQSPAVGGAADLGGGLAVPDFELDEVDMQFLSAYNHAVPFEFGRGSSQWELTFGFPGEHQERLASVGAGMSPATASQTRHSHHPTSAPSSSSFGPEAFRRHHWRFQPNTRDHAGAEEHNLSLPPADAHEHASPESRVSVNARVTAAPLSVSTRDKILAAVIKSCRTENLTRVVTFFPSVELLDKLLQYYLSSPLARADAFIHAPTFDPNTKKEALLLAMAAAGAVLTSDATLTKLGYAMQEVVRPAVAALWESDNTLTRNLELLQAFLIYLEIGIWSGQSRKIEITESFLQAPLTMLRRAGRFKSSAYQNDASSSPLAPLGHDSHVSLSEAELTDRWQAWVHQESYKRTAFRFLTHDTNSSMCLLVNPLLSYAELSFPLPCAPSIWAATSHHRWKALLLQTHFNLQSHQTQPPPQTIADFADDPGAYVDSGNSHQPDAAFDIPLANQAFLSYAWSLCWEYTQLASLCRSTPRRWSTLLLSSRQDEILKLLHHFRVVTEDSSPAATVSAGEVSERQAARMKLEHVLLHMHAPLEEIQTFAGMEGPEQAAGAHAVIIAWAASQAARTAVWHASQIVRAARRIARGAVQGPLAFSLYHAGLVLWTYALVSSGGQQQQQQQQDSRQQKGRNAEAAVFLDEDGESMALQRFMQLGAGRPCFRSGVLHRPVTAGEGADGDGAWEEEVFLEEPDKVMMALVQVLMSNHRGLPRPHLADRLIQLMETLQRNPGIMGG